MCSTTTLLKNSMLSSRGATTNWRVYTRLTLAKFKKSGCERESWEVKWTTAATFFFFFSKVVLVLLPPNQHAFTFGLCPLYLHTSPFFPFSSTSTNKKTSTYSLMERSSYFVSSIDRKGPLEKKNDQHHINT